jgi:hypothetical protein
MKEIGVDSVGQVTQVISDRARLSGVAIKRRPVDEVDACGTPEGPVLESVQSGPEQLPCTFAAARREVRSRVMDDAHQRQVPAHQAEVHRRRVDLRDAAISGYSAPVAQHPGDDGGLRWHET